MPFQVFISYARDDDTVVSLPGQLSRDAEEPLGFVSSLKVALEKAFKHMRPRPKLFFDNAIRKSEQFDPRLRSEIEASQALLVVLSPNWMEREWCRKELELFKTRWGSDARNRIVVVLKTFIEPSGRTDLLQGQDTYKFFTDDDLRGEGHYKAFFDPRGMVSSAFLDRVMEIAEDLRSRAERFEAAPQNGGGVSNGAPRERTIFLAKPAPDMKPAYSRVAEELRRKGYRVVPDPSEQIPYDGGAIDFIDGAIGQAELSVHLLGEEEGSAPADSSDRIVRLQLARAALREQPFSRIIWAPKAFGNETARDSLAVLARFEQYRDGDQVDDSEESKFLDFLAQHLASKKRAAVHAASAVTLHPNSRVFIQYCSEDEEYAYALADALSEREIGALLEANDEPDRLISDDLNRKRLAQCDAIVGCWGNVTEARVFAALYRYLEWPELQRADGPARRLMIAAPPEQARKKFYVKRPPRPEVDAVIDLTDHTTPRPEDLDPLIDGEAS